MHVVITIDVDDAKIDLVAGAMRELRSDLSQLAWQLLEVEKRVVPHVVERRRRDALGLTAAAPGLSEPASPTRRGAAPTRSRAAAGRSSAGEAAAG
jgi:hypothetical protein